MAISREESQGGSSQRRGDKERMFIDEGEEKKAGKEREALKHRESEEREEGRRGRRGKNEHGSPDGGKGDMGRAKGRHQKNIKTQASEKKKERRGNAKGREKNYWRFIGQTFYQQRAR